MKAAPQVRVHSHPEYHVKQSPTLPTGMVHTPYRMTVLGASGQGNTQFLQSWSLDFMPQHDRYYTIGHSIHQDPMRIPVKRFIEESWRPRRSIPNA